MTTVIPDRVKLAAKRGFIRTATQSLASAIPTGIVLGAITGDALLSAGLAAGTAILGSVLAGTASALTIISAGVPDDYQVNPDETTGRYAR